jgi:uncharacterized coiled-coil DUF342 family protein
LSGLSLTKQEGLTLTEDNAEKIEALNRESSALRQERDRLNGEAKAWAEKRNAINEQTRALRDEAKQLRDKRDDINQKVKELKSLREQAKNAQKEKRAEALKIKEKIRVATQKKPSQPLAEIQKEIESLEWRIQTTSIPVKEEKALVDQVRILESQRNVYKQFQGLRNTLIELQTRERALATQAKFYHKKLAELVEQGQEFHKHMLELLTKAQKLRADANAAHEKHVELRQKASETHRKLVGVLQKVDSLKQEIRKNEDARQTEKQRRLREEALRKAKEKMERGEKLAFEEFKLLTEQEAE